MIINPMVILQKNFGVIDLEETSREINEATLRNL